MMKKYFIGLLVLIPLITITAVNFKFMSTKLEDATVYAKNKVTSAFQAPDREWKNNEVASDKVHLRSVKPDMQLDEILRSKNIDDKGNFSILIDLDSRTLYLKYKEEVIKQYAVSAGKRSKDGKKEKEGDYKTPIGVFYICQKEVYDPPKTYLGSRWMMLSYPGLEAAEEGLEKKMISKDDYNKIKESYSDKVMPPQTTKLGSYIGIHGGATPDYPRDWTAGCIGMYNQDVEEIYKYVKNGTTVIIR
ncbi:MAG TPA: L,D-transpeptidase [Pseudobacteroides sp.]